MMPGAGSASSGLGPILLVEDDDVDAEHVQRMLSRGPAGEAGPECVRVTSLAAALEKIRLEGKFLVLLDLILPDSCGLDALDRLLEAKPGPVVVMSDLEDRGLALEAVRHGAQDYLVKGKPGAESFWRCLVYSSERDRLQRELGQQVDELASLNVQLEQHREELARAHLQQMQLKDQLLSHVSHELRTPLTALHQLVGVVRDGVVGPVNTEQHEFLSVAYRNAEQLSRMIDDLVDVARASANKLRVELQVVPLRSLVHDTLESFAPRAAQAGVRLGHDLALDLPDVLCDPVRVRQVLGNLVDNALKFTNPGGAVLVSSRKDPENPGMLRTSVADDGLGMSENALDRVFERLHQEPGALEPTSARHGLGLGLYIARQLVERQGGRIWADSHRGAGSTFHFTLAAWSLVDALRPLLIEGGQLGRPGWVQLRIAAPSGGVFQLGRQSRRLRKALRAILGPGQVLLPCSVKADGGQLWSIVFDGGAMTSQRLEQQVAGVAEHLALGPHKIEVEISGGLEAGAVADPDRGLAAMAARLGATFRSPAEGSQHGG